MTLVVIWVQAAKELLPIKAQESTFGVDEAAIGVPLAFKLRNTSTRAREVQSTVAVYDKQSHHVRNGQGIMHRLNGPVSLCWDKNPGGSNENCSPLEGKHDVSMIAGVTKSFINSMIYVKSGSSGAFWGTLDKGGTLVWWWWHRTIRLLSYAGFC
ncbi:hypothetical protein BV22DRAFT_1050427 [Leucogyrophana mollusca]|uniref:Uncharacterized protein n=1 Tax=Leucogyrophana mollusca TaxID=85980 RepID=A0ACB8B418_9AGAM|nr:hypothetical protein BV22DRAFT_1050427 [Leucogyrophana mollusca]